MKEELENLFYYDETSPTFLRWKIDRMSGRNYAHCRVKAGDVAGTISGDGRYFDTYYNRRIIRVHRIIALLAGMEIPRGYFVDHFDGNGLNNKVCNLRIISQASNCKNRGMQYNNTSGVTGVNRKTEKTGQSYWVARWQNEVGKRSAKNFSIALHGEETAYKLAVEFRQNKIEELNLLGHGYTERHGK